MESSSARRLSALRSPGPGSAGVRFRPIASMRVFMPALLARSCPSASLSGHCWGRSSEVDLRGLHGFENVVEDVVCRHFLGERLVRENEAVPEGIANDGFDVGDDRVIATVEEG